MNMKLRLLMVLIVPFLLQSCNWSNKTINGNGNITKVTKTVKKAERLVFKGNFEVILQPGEVGVEIETDENIQSLVMFSENNRELVFKTKNRFNINSDHGIRITITTPVLRSVHLGGSGTVIGKGKFLGGEDLEIDIAGNGEVTLAVNTPKVKAKIAGVGNLNLKGETQRAEFNIAGSGDCDALELKAETAKVKVAGTGTLKVFASQLLDVNVMGSGNVYYKGDAEVKQKIMGVGSIKRME